MRLRHGVLLGLAAATCHVRCDARAPEDEALQGDAPELAPDLAIAPLQTALRSVGGWTKGSAVSGVTWS